MDAKVTEGSNWLYVTTFHWRWINRKLVLLTGTRMQDLAVYGRMKPPLHLYLTWSGLLVFDAGLLYI